MTQFYDLRVHSTMSVGESTPSELVEFIDRLGISGICLADFAQKTINDFAKLKDKLRTYNADVFSRVDFSTKSTVTLKRALGHIRGGVDVVGVEYLNRNVLSFAARDSRVDIVIINPENAKMFRRTAAKLAAKNNTAVEISLRWIISTHGFSRINILGKFRKVVEEAVSANAPLLLSSGAINKYQLRAPRELIAIARLLDIDETKAKEALSDVPKQIINRNIEKRDPNYIMKGVKIVK